MNKQEKGSKAIRDNDDKVAYHEKGYRVTKISGGVSLLALVAIVGNFIIAYYNATKNNAATAGLNPLTIDQINDIANTSYSSVLLSSYNITTLANKNFTLQELENFSYKLANKIIGLATQKLNSTLPASSSASSNNNLFLDGAIIVLAGGIIVTVLAYIVTALLESLHSAEFRRTELFKLQDKLVKSLAKIKDEVLLKENNINQLLLFPEQYEAKTNFIIIESNDNDLANYIELINVLEKNDDLNEYEKIKERFEIFFYEVASNDNTENLPIVIFEKIKEGFYAKYKKLFEIEDFEINNLSNFKEIFNAFKSVKKEHFENESDFVNMCEFFIKNLLDPKLGFDLEVENKYYKRTAKEYNEYAKSYTYFFNQNQQAKVEIKTLKDKNKKLSKEIKKLKRNAQQTVPTVNNTNIIEKPAFKS